jgi:phospholipase/lecithinase/hemolysin
MRFAELFPSLRLSVFTPQLQPTTRAVPKPKLARILPLLAIVLGASGAVLAHAEPYTSVVIFGDSLSDTGNLAATTYVQCGIAIPGPAVDYAFGLATDGPYTTPRAQLFTGLWVEQLAAALPTHPAVAPSSVGGTNYAFGSATNSNGTYSETFSGMGESCTVKIVDIGQQITDYLATRPRIDDHTLFIVWGGANDLLSSTSTKNVIDAAIKNAENIQRLIQAGATQFLIPNLPPLGETPAVLATPSLVSTANEATVLYNDALSATLDILSFLNFSRHLTIYRLNTFALFKAIVSEPSKFYIDNVQIPAQGLSAVDPDTYLFWDTVHPTTKGHNLLALAALKLLDPSLCAGLPAGMQSPPCEKIP